MIEVENITSYNHARAIYSARNAMNSWDKSDSDLENNIVGKKDLKLAKRLFKAGTEHRKYSRQIFVSMDITAPLYWWKEFDTYKVGTTSNSCSTMHKIHDKYFTREDFSWEHLSNDILVETTDGTKWTSVFTLDMLTTMLNLLRDKYLETKDKKYWWQMIQLLPSSYNQKRTVTMTYENVFSMIHQRTGHKLDEWREFVEILKALPYVTEIMEGGTE